MVKHENSNHHERSSIDYSLKTKIIELTLTDRHKYSQINDSHRFLFFAILERNMQNKQLIALQNVIKLIQSENKLTNIKCKIS